VRADGLKRHRKQRAWTLYSRNGTPREAPGCAVGISRNGAIVYEHGYGMASIDASMLLLPWRVLVGSASANAWRMIRRCTPNFFATLLTDDEVLLETGEPEVAADRIQGKLAPAAEPHRFCDPGSQEALGANLLVLEESTLSPTMQERLSVSELIGLEGRISECS
jgi:hypothetical protein